MSGDDQRDRVLDLVDNPTQKPWPPTDVWAASIAGAYRAHLLATTDTDDPEDP